MKLIEAKDKKFHQHIVKNRVDPTAQSATNPVPDFYGKSCRVISRPSPNLTLERRIPGEKIGSLHDYRQVRGFA